MKRSKPSSTTTAEGTPAFDSFHGGLFADPDQARRVLKAIGRFMRGNAAVDEAGNAFAFHGFAIEETEISFRADIKRMKMRTSFASGRCLIVAPMQSGESDESLRQRETTILAAFSATAHAAHMRSSFQFWISLDKEAQEKLLRDYGD